MTTSQLYKLFCDHTASDAVAGVAAGIGLHVIGFGVDDEGGAAVAEQRVGAVAEGDVIIFQRCLGFSLSVGGEILHVAGVVAFRVF